MSGDPSVRPRAAAALALSVFFCFVAAPAQHRARAAQAPANTPLLCIGADGVLRAAGVGGTCAAGQRTVPMATPSTGACTSDPWNGTNDCDPSPPAGDDTLDAFDARLTKLERRPLFEVIDKDSRPILQVASGKAVLSNAEGDQVVELRARERGADLLVKNAFADQVAMSVSGDVGGLVVTEAGVKRVEFGKQRAGNVSLRFPRGAGLAAAIGESQGISGALVVGDDLGRPRTLMSMLDDKGSLSIQNLKGAPVLALTEGATHGGLLAIGDIDSEPMVKFGVNDNRYGVVLAGPVSGFPLVPNSGLPGSYFLGCAGGDKCGPGGGGSR